PQLRALAAPGCSLAHIRALAHTLGSGSFRGRNPPLKNAASLATFAALALLGVVLAYWSWAWLAPAALPRAPAVESLGGTSAAAGALFRIARDGSAAAAPTGVRLMGVVAATGGKRGHAVLRLEEKKTVA